MSFKCEFCKKTAEKGTKLHMVPVEIRQKQYGNDSFGAEIVREKRCCESCWKNGVGDEPKIVSDIEVRYSTKIVDSNAGIYIPNMIA